MKRKPLSKAEWTLFICPLLVIVAIPAIQFVPFPLQRGWVIWKQGTPSTWQTLTWSQDGRYIAIGGGVDIPAHKVQGQATTKPPLSRGDLELYDARGTFVRRFVGHGSPVRKVEFSPDSKVLMGSNAGGLRLWDVATGQQLRSVTLPCESVQWAKDGKVIEGRYIKVGAPASGGFRNYQAVYVHIDPGTGAIRTVTAPAQPPAFPQVRSAAGFTAVQRPTKSQMISHPLYWKSETLYRGGEIDVFNPKGQTVQTLRSQTLCDMRWRGDHILAMLCPIRGNYETVGMVLVTTDVRSRKQRWQMLNLEPIEKPTPTTAPPPGQPWNSSSFPGKQDIPWVGVMARTGRRAAVWSYKTLWLVDVASGSAIEAWALAPGYFSTQVAFSPNGQSLAWVDGRDLHVVDATTGAPIGM